MGAISNVASIPVLEEYLNKPGENISVIETCEIALDKIRHDHASTSSSTSSTTSSTSTLRSLYDSIDPAPAMTLPAKSKQPSSMHDTSSSSHPSTDIPIPELQAILMDPSKSLFERYRAMFALRNIGPDDKEAVLALASGFKDTSALFRHEVAYIFGQLSSEHSVPSLIEVLKDEQENEMVRHEAAEALGSIATEDVLDTLREFATKGPRVVRESCEVALDMYEVRNSL
jgi:deoxyhypusine monooxygenase